MIEETKETASKLDDSDLILESSKQAKASRESGPGKGPQMSDNTLLKMEEGEELLAEISFTGIE